jgi:endonuclease-3
MNKEKRTEIFSRLRRENPDPKTELEYSSTFELLISVILSAQATDVSVNKATKKLYAVANTPEKIFALGVAGLKIYIKTIGLFNTKAVNVIKTCNILVQEHNSVVPDKRELLEALPGVGRKTANVVLNTAFRQIAMAVDTHIFRISNRTGIAPGKNVLEVDKISARRILARCTSLANFTWTLRLPGAQAPLRSLRHRRPLRVSQKGLRRISQSTTQLYLLTLALSAQRFLVAAH